MYEIDVQGAGYMALIGSLMGEGAAVAAMDEDETAMLVEAVLWACVALPPAASAPILASLIGTYAHSERRQPVPVFEIMLECDEAAQHAADGFRAVLAAIDTEEPPPVCDGDPHRAKDPYPYGWHDTGQPEPVSESCVVEKSITFDLTDVLGGSERSAELRLVVNLNSAPLSNYQIADLVDEFRGGPLLPDDTTKPLDFAGASSELTGDLHIVDHDGLLRAVHTITGDDRNDAFQAAMREWLESQT